MSDLHLPTPHPDDEEQPEVRLELTQAGVQQVLSLYSLDAHPNGNGDGYRFSLADVEAAFRERRRMLAIGALIGFLVPLLIVLFSTRIYPVSAQVVIERHDVTSSSPSAGSSAGGSAFVATQAEVMQSLSVVRAAVERLPRAAYLDPDDDPVRDALARLRASPVSGTQVIALGYLGPDPRHGSALIEAVVGAYRDVLQKNEEVSQAQKLRAKQAEIEALEAEAIDSESRLLALRESKALASGVTEAATAQTTLLQDLQNQLARARNDRITLENRLATGSDQIAILDPATRTLQEQLWAAEAELARIRLGLTDRHPAVEAARQRVRALRGQLRSSSRATPDALRRDLAATKGLEAQLGAIYQEELARMGLLEADRREETLLLAELDRIRTMTDARRRELLDQRLVTRLAESGEVGITARMIEPPTLPDGPSWPKPKLLLPAGLLLGLLVGLVAAIVSLHRSRTAPSWHEQARESEAYVR